MNSCIVDADSSVCKIWNIGICNPKHRIVKENILTSDGKVVVRSLQEYFSADCPVHFTENLLYQRLDASDSESVEVGRGFYPAYFRI